VAVNDVGAPVAQHGAHSADVSKKRQHPGWRPVGYSAEHGQPLI